MSILDMMGVNSGMDDVEIVIIRGGSNGAGFINGRYYPGDASGREEKSVTLQSVNPNEINFITGGQRISDVRKFYLNDGTELHAENGDKVEINGTIWTVESADNRPWHNYCKAIIVKHDPKKVKKDA